MPRLDDLAQPVIGADGVVDVDHEDVTPGGAALPAELLLDAVSPEAHEHAVRSGNEAPSVAIDEADILVITPAVCVLPVDDPPNLSGGVRRFGEVCGLVVHLAVAGARVEDVGHQRCLARVVPAGAAWDEEEGLVVRVSDLGELPEDREALRGNAMLSGDLCDDFGRHAPTFGVLQPLCVVALRV